MLALLLLPGRGVCMALSSSAVGNLGSSSSDPPGDWGLEAWPTESQVASRKSCPYNPVLECGCDRWLALNCCIWQRMECLLCDRSSKHGDSCRARRLSLAHSGAVSGRTGELMGQVAEWGPWGTVSKKQTPSADWEGLSSLNAIITFGDS